MIDVHSVHRTANTYADMWPALMPMRPVPSSLEQLCADVTLAVDGPIHQRDRRVATALVPYLGLPDLLNDAQCQCSPDRYVRHLLHAGEDFTILALVWRPGQMSPVHAHLTWCAFGLHRGWMAESFFTRGPQGAVPRACLERRAGDIAHDAADPDGIHRLANLGTETAVSIHVYGARYDRLGEHVNQIWAS